jgi:hypothetical protein
MHSERNYIQKNSILKNIKKYSDPGLGKSSIIVCIVNKVHPNMTADIYIPHTSSLVLEVPILFPSYSEGSGSISSIEQGSLALYIYTSDRKKFVFGGLSLAETYTVRNILPGEHEQYLENCYFKQDVSGKQVLDSGLSRKSISAEGEVKEYYSKLSYEYRTPSLEIFKGVIGGQYFEYQIFYKVSGGESISPEKKNTDAVKLALSYITELQNARYSGEKEAFVKLRENIHLKYRFKREVVRTVEIGGRLADGLKIRDLIDFKNLREKDIIRDCGTRTRCYTGGAIIKEKSTI